MSKHFDDARYYLGRAATHAKAGIREELAPVEGKVRSLVGDDAEPEPTRLERITKEVEALDETAEREAREAVAAVREKVGRRRSETMDGEQAA